MPNTLISGPAGSGKTELAAQLRRDLPEAVIADFNELLTTLLGIVRLPNGRYPERLDSDGYAMALAELLRHTIIRQARERELTVITTSSDGDPTRRAFLLGLLGPDAEERIIDPGRVVVEARLSRPDGTLSSSCAEALQRWYGRLQRERQEARNG